jgi:hypothetical protein
LAFDSLEDRVVLSSYTPFGPSLATGPGPALAASGTYTAADGAQRTFLAVDYGTQGPAGNKGGVDIFLGDGSGHFSGPQNIKIPGQSQPEGIVTGHFASLNADDIGVVDDNNRVFIIKGNGDGTFQQPKLLPGLAPGRKLQLSYLAAAEIDNASYLFVPYYGKNSVLVYKQNGRTGKLALKATIPHVNAGEQIAVADFNGDGHVDLAVANDGATSVTIIPGKGHGKFGRPRVVPLTTNHYVKTIGITAANLDGDGDLDLAVATEGAVKLLDNTSTPGGPISFRLAGEIDYPDAQQFLINVVAVKLAGEALPALVVTNPSEGTLSLFPNQGQFHFDFNQRKLLPLSGPGAAPVGVIAVDLSGEGATPGPSLVVTNGGTNSLDILQPSP